LYQWRSRDFFGHHFILKTKSSGSRKSAHFFAQGSIVFESSWRHGSNMDQKSIVHVFFFAVDVRMIEQILGQIDARSLQPLAKNEVAERQ